MKIEIHYYELQKKEFRSKKKLKEFLNRHLDSEILWAREAKNGNYLMLELGKFLMEHKYQEEE